MRWKTSQSTSSVYVADVGWNEEHVVRWCADCGGVVVDRESDNRLFGKVVKMRFPKYAYEHFRKTRENQ